MVQTVGNVPGGNQLNYAVKLREADALAETSIVVVFDGACNFCNGWVRFLLEHDRARRFRFAAATSTYGALVLSAMGERADDPSTLVLIDGERRYVRSDAVLRAVAALGGGWTAARMLLLVPRGLRDAGYLAFARRRIRWFGRAETCPAPEPGWRDRFLA